MPAKAVVSDTSPLIALAAIGSFHLLGEVYESVHVPASVLRELRAGEVDGVAVPAPEWLRIEEDAPARDRRLLYDLDDGEAQAILLARNLMLPLLMDEKRGRRVAEHLQVAVSGTVGFLARCRREDRIPSFREYASRLRSAGVHLTDRLVDLVAAELGE